MLEKPQVHLVVPELVYRLKGVRIDYDLTPRQTIELLPGSDSDIANWPEELMELWNGGKTGVVENAVLPFLWDRQSSSTAQDRQKQAPIGFALPVEIASLALPENDPQRIRKELNDLGIWALVALRPSDEGLLRLDGYFRSFCFGLDAACFGFRLGFSDRGWVDIYALPGSPEVPTPEVPKVLSNFDRFTIRDS